MDFFRRILHRFKVDPFVTAIVCCIALAYFYPQAGSENSQIPLDEIGHYGVALIFFFYGLKLNPEKLKNGLNNWRLHLLVQASTFVLFPLTVLLFRPLIQTEMQENIWLAFLFLAALPSTVSSSVVMVSMAKGNLPAAIFNASISGLIGILVTPLWMGLLMNHSTQEFDLSDIYVQLIVGIIVPVILGLMLQKHLGKFVVKFQKQLTLFDQSIILLIIYKSFATSFESNLFSQVSTFTLVLIGILSIILFFLVYYLIGWMADRMHFNREDKITAQYCGTKKSLVHGTVFSKILFPIGFPLGIILLPLMIFHAFQIFIITIFARQETKKIENDQVL